MQHSPTRLGSRQNVCRRVNNLRHTYFKPELVDALLTAAEREVFWITQEPAHLRDYLQLQARDQDELFLNTNQLRNLARIFAEIVDAKSPYTAEHSFDVTRLAGYLAEHCLLTRY